MTTHILAITYQPKIEAVKSLECRQTTRVFNPMYPREVGNFVLPHGWSGLPYRSPWSWRLPKMPITQIIDLFAFEHTAGFWQNPLTGKPIGTESCLINYIPWQDPIMDELSRLDGISPPTGLEYQNVLESYHGKFTDKPVQMQVIRW